MNVLITGGAGFIGSHLAEALLAQGRKVLVLDDLSTGSMANLEPFLRHERFDYRIGSALDFPLVLELVDRADVVVHLAAAVGVKLIVERPVHTIETNVRATEVVLDAASRKTRPVVVASTSEVYGKSTKTPFSEDDDISLGATNRSRWAYACSKALDEWLALAYMREKDVPVTIVRFFNTVGPRQVGRYGMVVPNFVQQAMRDEALTVFGDGSQSRCFGHVQDAVKAVAMLLDEPRARGEVFNVGNDEEVTILELARQVIARTQSSSEIRFVPYEEAYAEGFEDMPRRVPDLRKLEGLCGFRPRTPLGTIIDDVRNDLRRRGEA